MLNIMKLRFLLLKKDYKVIVLMMILSLVFTFVFGSAGSQSEQVTIGLALSSDNQQEGAFLDDFIEKHDGNYVLFTEETLEVAISNDEIILGALFKKDQIELIKKSNRFEVIQSEISFKNHLRQMYQDEKLITFMSRSLGSYEDVALQFDNEQKSNKSFGIHKTYFGQSKWSNFDGLLQGILGFTLYFSTFSMVFGMGDIVEDKRLYTWHRLLTTPVKLKSIIFGNLAFYSVLGIFQISMVFLLGQWLFDVEFNGQLLGVLFITTLYVIVMNGLGLVIATHVKDAHQLSAVSPIILTAMAMIGGCMWPIEIVTSKVLLGLSYVTPHRWAIRAIKEVVQAGSMTPSYLMSVAVLVGMASISIIIGSFKILRKPI